MDDKTIIVKKENGVSTIILNRPERLNAISSEMVRELQDATAELERDKGVKVVVLAAVGRAFCSGADMLSPAVIDNTGGELMDGVRLMSDITLNLRRMPKPVLAAVNGPAVAAGFNLVLACDIIIASEKASFGEVFVKIGLHPDLGGTFFLPRLIGTSKACELMFTGKTIDAKEAERIGIVNQVVPHGQLESVVADLASSLAKGPSLAIELVKKSIYQGMTMDLASVIDMEARAQAICMLSEDSKEGAKAFLEKRPPMFKGR